MIPPYTKTKDNFELQFGTNHLGHFSLTLQLLPILMETPNSRIVNVSSLAHRFSRLNLQDPNWNDRKYNPWQAYGDSKIANLYFTFELNRRLKRQNSSTIATAAHPGWTSTNLQAHVDFIMFWNKRLAQNAKMGALPSLYAAISDDIRGGDYIGPDGIFELWGYPRKVKAIKRAHDTSIGQKLWTLSEELCSIQSSV